MTPATPLVRVWSCNQLRQKIGVVYGNPETTTGGNALEFYASVRLDIRKIGVVKNGEQVVGNKTRAKVVKNKVAPPFRECEFEILYGAGVNAIGEIVDLASEAGLLEESGAYYAWNSERIAQGRDKACQYMVEHPELFEELRAKLVALRKAENARLGAPVPVAGGARRRHATWCCRRPPQHPARCRVCRRCQPRRRHRLDHRQRPCCHACRQPPNPTNVIAAIHPATRIGVLRIQSTPQATASAQRDCRAAVVTVRAFCDFVDEC